MAFSKKRESLTTTGLCYGLTLYWITGWVCCSFIDIDFPLPQYIDFHLPQYIFVHSTLTYTIAVNFVKLLVLREFSNSHVPSRKFHPGDCASVDQANFTNGPSRPLGLYTLYSLKNTSNNGIVLTVENSSTLLVDFCWFSGKSEPCPVQQKKFIYQVYIETHKCTLEEHLKTFARLRYDWISLALELGQISL